MIGHMNGPPARTISHIRLIPGPRWQRPSYRTRTRAQGAAAG